MDRQNIVFIVIICINMATIILNIMTTIKNVLREKKLENAKWLYRLESRDAKNGLWYNSLNQLVWGIGKLDGCKTKYLPMNYDKRYHKNGKNWYSSCSRKKDLSHWYSLEDAKNLIANGFVFTKYLAVDYVEYDMETTFLKETALARVELNIEDIWEVGNG